MRIFNRLFAFVLLFGVSITSVPIAAMSIPTGCYSGGTEQTQSIATSLKEFADDVDNVIMPCINSGYFLSRMDIENMRYYLDELKSKEGRMTPIQLAQFIELCEVIKPAISSYYSKFECLNHAVKLKFSVTINDVPATIVVAAKGNLFKGKHIAYFYYNSDGDKKRQYLTLTPKKKSGGQMVNSILVVNSVGTKIGKWLVSSNGSSIEEGYDYYTTSYVPNNDAECNVAFLSDIVENAFVEACYNLGYRPFIP